jgi:hypothetical protein
VCISIISALAPVSNLAHSDHSSATAKKPIVPKPIVPELMMSDVVVAPKPLKPVLPQPRERKLGDPGKPKVLKKRYGPGGAKSRPFSQMRAIKFCKNMFGPVLKNIAIVSPLSETMKDLMPQHDAGSEAFLRA